jgi:hypothetical protein
MFSKARRGKQQQPYARRNARLSERSDGGPPGFFLGATFPLTAIARLIALAAAAIVSASSPVRP